jgi:hypothetical protein
MFGDDISRFALLRRCGWEHACVGALRCVRPLLDTYAIDFSVLQILNNINNRQRPPHNSRKRKRINGTMELPGAASILASFSSMQSLKQLCFCQLFIGMDLKHRLCSIECFIAVAFVLDQEADNMEEMNRMRDCMKRFKA